MQQQSNSGTIAHRRLRELIALLIVLGIPSLYLLAMQLIPEQSLRYGHDIGAGLYLIAGFQFLAIPIVVSLIQEHQRLTKWYAGVAVIATVTLIALGMLSGYNNPY
jgi:putative effector of murein hydrolase LrgA (UPF0299 family)